MNEETPQIEPAEAAMLLERFVVENDALTDLEREIGRFNIFDSLRIVDQEIRHSNFLAWLLNPAESHGLGQLFLRAVLMDILREAPRDNRPMSPVDLDGTDLGGVRVEREWRNIDLLIVADDPKIVIAIENKVHSGEHSRQLERYEETVGRKFPQHRKMFVFLTREGDEPSRRIWTSYSYRQLHAALDRCRKLNGDAIGGDTGVFLDHYLRIVRSRFMDDEEINELCERIYRNHRQALDLIFEKRGDPRQRLVTAFCDAIHTDSTYWALHRASLSCEYAPLQWQELLPPIALSGKLEPKPVIRCGLWVGQQGATAYVHMTPSSDSEERTRIVDAIKGADRRFGFRLSRQKTGEEWTTVYNYRIIRNKDGLVDDDETIEKFRDAAAHMRERTEKMTPFLESLFR